MAYRYYSTLRPLMVGGIPFPKQPGESITTIVNFEEGRTYCKDIDRPAWGYIEYTAPLDQQQVSDYELVQAPQEATRNGISSETPYRLCGGGANRHNGRQSALH